MNALRTRLMDIILANVKNRFKERINAGAVTFSSELFNCGLADPVHCAFIVWLARSVYQFSNGEIHLATKIPANLIDSIYEAAREVGQNDKEERAWFFRVVAQLTHEIDETFVHVVAGPQTVIRKAETGGKVTLMVHTLVASYFDLPLVALQGKFGDRKVTAAKFFAWMLLNKVCGSTVRRISLETGFNYWTVRHGIIELEAWMEADGNGRDKFSSDYKSLVSIVQFQLSKMKEAK